MDRLRAIRVPAYWLAVAAIAGALAVLFLRKPQVEIREKVRIEEKVKVETRWRANTQTKIVGAPGSRTTVHPDGSYTIEGPVTVEMSSSATGDVVRAEERIERREKITRETIRHGIMLSASHPFSFAFDPMIGLDYTHYRLPLAVRGGVQVRPGAWDAYRVEVAVGVAF